MINEESQRITICCANCEKQYLADKKDVNFFDEATGEEKVGTIVIVNGGEKIVSSKSRAGAPIAVATCPNCSQPMYSQ